ncbi:hypothetical protein [Microbacterium sp. 13-71-7]|uniref:hypothetical protein n=1 Tax=Microbacterium sp. 13-71-7 TaxID=1970399 RepID=UPI000BD605B6|nr:hypothetical protein [Microbacterium sp. 13-71-7]OZB85397.1 MAG: hypothetical protein B7X32_03650 [Microbacterium sp. 13-71-7]
MTDVTPTVDSVRDAYMRDRYERDDVYGSQSYAEFQRFLSALSSLGTIEGLGSRQFVVGCACCGARKVIANDPLNTNLEVCGDCGVTIGRDLPKEEGPAEWEYGIRYALGSEEFEGDDLENLRQRAEGIRQRGGRYVDTCVIRRRPAGDAEEVPDGE